MVFSPLVAYFDRRDAYHRWAVSASHDLPLPFITSESVISETLFLLKGSSVAVEAVLNMLEDQTIRVAVDFGNEVKWLTALLRRYRNVPMSVADATLVRLSEIHPNARVFTLDRDFTIYRRNRRQHIALLAPWTADN